MSDALDRIEALSEEGDDPGRYYRYQDAVMGVVPLLVAVARAAEGFRGWPNVHLDDALAAVERYATENLPEEP